MIYDQDFGPTSNEKEWEFMDWPQDYPYWLSQDAQLPPPIPQGSGGIQPGVDPYSEPFEPSFKYTNDTLTSTVYFDYINNAPHLSGHFAGMWNGRNEWQELLDGKPVSVIQKFYEGGYDVPSTYVKLLNGVVEVWEENFSWGYQNYKIAEIPLEQVLQENAPIVHDIYIPNIYIQPDPEIRDFTTDVTLKKINCIEDWGDLWPSDSSTDAGWSADEDWCNTLLIGRFKCTEWKALLEGSTGTLKYTGNNRVYNIKFNNQTNYSSEYMGGPIGAFTGTFIISDGFNTIAYITYEQVARDNAPLGCEMQPEPRIEPIPINDVKRTTVLNNRWSFYGFEEDAHLVGRFTPEEWLRLQAGNPVDLVVAGENKALQSGLQIAKAPQGLSGYMIFAAEFATPFLLPTARIDSENAPLSGGAVLSDVQIDELAKGSRVYVDESLYYEYTPATDTLRLINEIDDSVVKQGTFQTVLQVNKDGSAASGGSGILLALGIVGVALSMSNRKSK